MNKERYAEHLMRLEKRRRVSKNAEERGQRVLSKISDDLNRKAETYGLTSEEYRILLSDPEKYWQFLSGQEGQSAQLKLPDIPEVKPKINKRMKGNTTIFDVTTWDPAFTITHMLQDPD